MNIRTQAVLQPVSLEGLLEEMLVLDDEACLGPHWAQVSAKVKDLVLRPAKRFRPQLVLLGYRAASRSPGSVPDSVLRFAAGLELLHAFLLIHDDVADRAAVRRGGVALHHALAPQDDAEGIRLGEQQAIVAGDHLYSRALEVLLTSGAHAAAQATTYLLGVCRHTAIGQSLDLALSRSPLAEVTLFETLRVANLKTARYGFVAPLVCGAMLGGADAGVIDALSRVGRHAGVAFQLRDDLIGLFGDDRVAGKAGAGDYWEGKRTFPVVAAWTRASEEGRQELEALWNAKDKDEASCERARRAVQAFGGEGATERAIDRSTRAAIKALAGLSGPARTQLEWLISNLSHRAA